MADHIPALAELLSSADAPKDLPRRLRAGPAAAALAALRSVLRAAVEPGGDGRLGFSGWSPPQLHSVAALVKLVFLATRSLPVEHVDAVVVEIFELGLELSCSFLEKSEVEGCDWTLQDSMVRILESALVTGTDKECDLSKLCVEGNLLSTLPVLPVTQEFSNKEKKCIRYNYQGVDSYEEMKPADRVLITLASGSLHPDNAAWSREDTFQDLNILASLMQHFAIVKVGCMFRLIKICAKLARVFESTGHQIDGSILRHMLSFIIRVLKLLGYLANNLAYVVCDRELLGSVCYFADTLSNLFKVRIELVSHESGLSSDTGCENLLLLVLEGFLQFSQMIFCDKIMFQNLQISVLANLLDILDDKIWRYGNSNSISKPPLVYAPCIVSYLLKLAEDVKKWTSQIHLMDEKVDLLLFINLGYELGDDNLFCSVPSGKVYLKKKYACEEYLKLLFPPLSPWIDNLMHLVHYLHSEGVISRMKLDRSQKNCARTVSSLDAESVVSHEEDALFGNLFAEAGRNPGSGDGLDQTSVASSCHSYPCNLPLKAASELLAFLKTHIFCPGWHTSIYEDACNKLEESHIDVLISLLLCQTCSSDDKVSDCLESLSSLKRVPHINFACFELLHSLFVRRVLSRSLEEHLIEEIIKVENGAFTYNDETLALLAHAVICTPGLPGNHLRKRLHESFIIFMMEKAKSVSPSSANFKDFLSTLPNIMHVEIFLVAFHLSSEAEKAALAAYVFSSVKSVAVTALGSGGLEFSSLSMLVSKMLLLLHHMILYSTTCPSWLLMRLKNRLRNATCRYPLSVALHDTFPTSILQVMESIMGDSVKEMSHFLSQLTSATNAPVIWKDDHILGLDRNELCASLSIILDSWKGKKAVAVEDVILERYVFRICWEILGLSSASNGVLHKKQKIENINVANAESFFNFCHTVLSYDKEYLPDVVVSVLNQLSSASSITEVHGWNRLRNGSWLSLLVSVLNAGMQQLAVHNAIPGSECYITDRPSSDADFLAFAEGLVASLFDSGRVPWLFKSLSLLLRMQLEGLQMAFLCTFGHVTCSQDSALLLFKHTVFEDSRQNELLENWRSSVSIFDSIYILLPKLIEVVDKEDNGILTRIFLNSFIHGFPSHHEPASATLISCILSIKDIMCTLDHFLKLRTAEKLLISIDKELLHELLELVMMVKSDRIFGCIHDTCSSIYKNLISLKEGLQDYSFLFVWNHLEGFLKETNSREVIDANIHEWIILHAADFIDDLRKDTSKYHIFKIYVGTEENTLEGDMELVSEQHGNLLVLLDALDKCYSEPVNVKVLEIFIDLLSSELSSGLKEKIQAKFLSMDLHSISEWLGNRLLGCGESTSGITPSVKASPVPLRESTMAFLSSLLSPPSNMSSRALRDRFIEALLVRLNDAFVMYDILIGKAYFNFIVQLSNGDVSMKQLLRKAVMLMEDLAIDDDKLQGLKFLFGFLATVLTSSGISKDLMVKLSGKHLGCSRSGSLASRTGSSKKSSESLVFQANSGTGSASLDCDATSADEDDDDGTSDGELASLDKDEEDDNNSERALASKVCTFTSSGSNFMEQHWYFCYTCDLTVSKGCCSVCAKVCHRGHRVVYSRSSRFFCDCGAGGVRGSSCQCLKPRKFSGSSNPVARSAREFSSFLPLSEDIEQVLCSDSDLDDDVFADGDNMFNLSIPIEMQEALPSLLEDIDVEGRTLDLCSKLLPAIIRRRDSCLLKEKRVELSENKILCDKVEFLQLKKTYKSGSLDMKIKADYSSSRELKSHLLNGSIIKSVLSISTRGRIAAGEGDKVSIFDDGQLIAQPSITPITADKTNLKPLSRNVVRFEVVHLVFNPVVENYLAVAGFEECQILSLNQRGEVTDRLAIELALEGAYIRRVEWVPSSQVQLMVVTNFFVKIYDLSQDNISPIHYFTVPDDVIVDASLVLAPQGRLYLLVLSNLGSVFRLELLLGGEVCAKPLEDILIVQGKDLPSKGSSLYFSSTFRLLFLSYQDGTTLIGRLNLDATSLTEVSAIYEGENDGNLQPAGLHHWRELNGNNGLFVCCSSVKSNAALAVSLGPNELTFQNVRNIAGSASPCVGMTSYKPLSKDKVHCFVLHEDGSLHIFVHVPAGVDNINTITSDQAKKIGSAILNSRAYASVNPEFPLDFFEKTMCITADVKLNGDGVRNNDSEGIKHSLASEDGFLESPNPTGFKVTVSNSNPDIVMVGIRVHVGNTSASHIPSNISIFQRVIKLDEGMRSWYDIPFTVAESLLADEEFTITVCPTFNGAALPRLDSLEVYGRAKDEFGWKEKMDAVLDVETNTLGSSSGILDSGKKSYSMQAAPLQEQVVADGFKLLSKIYMLRKSDVCQDIEDIKTKLKNLRCRKLLEMVFESDRELLLQSAACRVLQAVFPKKEIYYQVKDTMRLLGVINSSPVLASRLGVGGATAAWVIKEFTVQVRAVSKIALHRRENMAMFLETHGSRVVDGLMQVLWGILDLEQPDTQTINNIVIPSVELIYSYAECLALHGNDEVGRSVKPAVVLLKKLLFAPYEAVQHSSSLAISSRLLQVPFPKQTMLSSDDVVENTIPAPATSEITGMSGGNNQVMIEEDSNTSSVQYSCDGCSTVPILRRRWHCNVCPDFDLCEACYEIMDADQLRPPHSRDHPMSAIPIEVDLIGGDGNDMHFSMNELDESNMLHVSSDVCIQSSSPSVHVPEQSETSGDFPFMVDQRIVSISASKRVVNSLLLRELVSELRGWMEETSGVRAIPVMQFFYRLSSAVGGPFMDGAASENLDLEKFVKWFLDEINMNKPFPAKTRSTFAEVVILVFMFFILMLRNWHQPGGESSLLGKSADAHDKASAQTPISSSLTNSVDGQEKSEFASQLLRACSMLRQQTFVNYLMDILQQLVVFFKSSPANIDAAHGLSPGPGCGALLTVRKELPAGNFSPFFSDSYAKAHRPDIFCEYHRLLLENTFRLVYSLVRPEKLDKSEKDKQEKPVHRSSSAKDLKLDGYQDILCSYINNPLTTYIRRYARRLFLHLCGNKTHYYSVRDSWQFSNEVKRLYKLVDKSGGFQIPISYERSVKLVKHLSAISEVASARPRNWQKYCHKHGDLLCFLMNGVFHFGEESVVQTLKLLNLAFYTGKDVVQTVQKSESGDAGTSSNKGSLSSDTKKKKKSDDSESSTEKAFLDMEQAVEVFNDKDGYLLRRFINCFLLEWNSAAVRLETKCVLYGVWCHAKQPFKELILKALLEKVKHFPVYGQNIVEYTELLVLLLGRSDASLNHPETELVSRCMTPDVINCIFDTLHSQNELLANHPNSRIYNTLSGLVEFDGYYLESEPCVACSCPEVPFAKMKLESLKSETKFTDNRIIVKCTGSYTIQAVTMTVREARKSKSVKLLNLYYNNRPVSDLAELRNSWPLWKRAKSCHLAFNQTELKVEFPIPITACNFMIELDSFYENLQASSLESLQCPRCSRSVTDRHGICGNCHENAYQCRQCRNINYENLDSFLCNECGYSKYGSFEFNFMAKPSFLFDDMENDDDMKKGLAAIESESENAHRRYQQLLGFKKPLLKLVSSIGENEIDSQQKDTVQQMMATISGPSCKINRKIALLGVLYGEKCKGAFDSVSKSVQTLQGLRRVLMNYLHQRQSNSGLSSSAFVLARSPSNCYGCATMFINQCLELLLVLSKYPNCKKQLVGAGILSELFQNNIHQGPKSARIQTRAVLCAFSDGDPTAVAELNSLIRKKVMYCLEHHRSMDIANATSEELLLLSEICSVADEFWEARLRIVFQLLFSSIKLGSKHPAISEHVILPCLRIITQACTLPKSDSVSKEHSTLKQTASLPKDDMMANPSISLGGQPSVNKPSPETSEKHWESSRRTQDFQLLSYLEWEKGASYIDFVRRQYKASQAVKSNVQRSRVDPQRQDYLALKYALKWKHYTCRRAAKNDFSAFELGSWISELILSLCSQSIRSETSLLVNLLCAKSSSRRFKLLKLLMGLLPATLSAGECSAEYFDLLFKMIESEDARLFLTSRGFLSEICKLITKEVGRIESLERSLRVDISQGFVLHKLIELLSKFLEIANIRSRFIRDGMLSEVLEALLVIRGVIVQKTKLISDCNKLLKDILDGLLLESSENKRHFIRACVSGLQKRSEERKGRTSLFILEQLCNLICPSKPEPVYLLILNKAHTQEEFIRGSMTKNPYSSSEIGPLMRDVKNKICHQLDLLGLLEDDFGMELLVAGNIISLDLSISLVYELVWKKSQSQTSNVAGTTGGLSSGGFSSVKDCPPMTVTYRLQGLDGEATEPMIKELEEEREEFQDPEVEFAIAGAVREYGGLEIILNMIQRWEDDELKSNPEELHSVLNLLMYCCKIRENRWALLRLGALGLLLETARRAFSVDAMESAEGILLIVENLTMEANESDIDITQSVLKVADEETGAGEQAKKLVLMFLERLCHPSGLKKSSKQQRNNEMVARILPYLTYGQPAAMEALIQYFDPYLRDWLAFDKVQKQHEENTNDEHLIQLAAEQRFAVENFVRVSESLKTSFCGEKLKDIILEKGIVEIAVRHLCEIFSCAEQAGYKSSAEWNSGLKLPSVPLILSMLRGLSRGHIATQRCIDDGGLLPLLHALEGVSGENEIGARAENLLDTLSDEVCKGDGFLGEKVNALRHATRDEMRRQALKKRQEVLKRLGMRQEVKPDGGERIIVSQAMIEGLDDMEEEEAGLACMVCREGYTLRPNDMLGVYSYSKRVNLGMGASGNARGECVYTTVSHFNIIHYQCHQEAKRADSALKNPKKEWEGATLRNNGTLCNCLFPVKGPAVPNADYVRCVDQYWDSLGALGRADGSRLRLLTYDIVLMLARFATGASFSADCKGGGRESNSRFLPFMIQMARHLLDQGGLSQRKAMVRSISTYLSAASSMDSKSSNAAGTRSSVGTEETVQFMMINSLLCESYDDWVQHRRAFLLRGIYHAYMQHTHGRSSTLRVSSDSSATLRPEVSSSNPKENSIFSIVMPMLVYTGLIEQLQKFLKGNRASSSGAKGSDKDSGESEGYEQWEVAMKERLLNVKEMVEFAKEVLSWLEAMTSSSDLQEAFNVMGAQGDALSGGFSRCEDFVQAAIDGVRE